MTINRGKINDFFEKAEVFFKRNEKKKILILLLVTAIILVAYFCSSDMVLGYKISYNGVEIAKVKNKSEYSRAFEMANSYLLGGDLNQYAIEPTFSPVLTVKKKLSSTDDIALNIISNTDNIVKGSALYVNKELKATLLSGAIMNNLSGERLNEYFAEDENVKSEFLDEIEITDIYLPSNTVDNVSKVREVFSSLQVKTVVIENEDTEIPYETVYKSSETRAVGEKVTLVNGVNGLQRKTTQCEYINGELISLDVISDSMITEKVDEIIAVGTYSKNYYAVSSSDVSSAGFIWPLQKVEGWHISAYFGDGRNHKGIDIACKTGTPIYAVQGGKVITAEYSSSYGNYVVIDHMNGYKTLYAHASFLYVTVGSYVTQGQPIAAVGETGYATGSHLHFEVHKNGVQVNPAPYINAN